MRHPEPGVLAARLAHQRRRRDPRVDAQIRSRPTRREIRPGGSRGRPEPEVRARRQGEGRSDRCAPDDPERTSTASRQRGIRGPVPEVRFDRVRRNAVAWWASVVNGSACRVSRRGAGFAEGCLLAGLLGAAVPARAARPAHAVGAREGDRNPCSASPAAGAGASGRASAASRERSGLARCVQPRVATGHLAVVLCHAGDASSLAPRAGRAPLEVSASSPWSSGDIS